MCQSLYFAWAVLLEEKTSITWKLELELNALLPIGQVTWAPTVSQFESLNHRRNRIGMISLLTGFQELDFECFCPFKQTGLCLRAFCRCHDNSQRLPMHKPNGQTHIIQNIQHILQEFSLWSHSNHFDFGHFRTSWQSSYRRDPVWEPDFSIAKCDHHFRR